MRAFIIFILFSLFILGSRWYYVCEFKGLCDGVLERNIIVNEAPKKTRLKNQKLLDGEYVLLKDHEQFVFNDETQAPEISADNSKFLDKVAAYLKANPNKKLRITGIVSLQLADSLNTEGLIRADTIRALLENRNIDAQRIILEAETSTNENAGLRFDLVSSADSLQQVPTMDNQ